MTVKILIVDDEPDVSVLIKQRFENEEIGGFPVEFFSAYNGEEALAEIEMNPDIQITLTDINMPVMDGLTLMTKLNERWPKVKVIVLSAYGDMKNIRESMREGAFDFITKPFDSNDLELTITKSIIEAAESSIHDKKVSDSYVNVYELQEEILNAKNLQRSLIPKSIPAIKGKKIDCQMHGIVVSGIEAYCDFFDVIPLTNELFGIVIGDVPNIGIRAAYHMSMTRSTMRSLAYKTDTPSECIRTANESLCSKNENETYASLFYGVVNTELGQFSYCNAGLPLPLVLFKDGSVKPLEHTTGIPLGEFVNSTYTDKTIDLDRVDSILFYTEGTVQVRNNAQELYTLDRLTDKFKNTLTLTAKETQERLLDDIKAFSQSVFQPVDILILCLKINVKTS